jgi:hypothetical protein
MLPHDLLGNRAPGLERLDGLAKEPSESIARCYRYDPNQTSRDYCDGSQRSSEAQLNARKTPTSSYSVGSKRSGTSWVRYNFRFESGQTVSESTRITYRAIRRARRPRCRQAPSFSTLAFLKEWDIHLHVASSRASDRQACSTSRHNRERILSIVALYVFRTHHIPYHLSSLLPRPLQSFLFDHERR